MLLSYLAFLILLPSTRAYVPYWSGLYPGDISSNNCVWFYIAPGTGCAWMCSYCQDMLGTTDYYFTDNVCKYEATSSGCVGTPMIGTQYTCCAL